MISLNRNLSNSTENQEDWNDGVSYVRFAVCVLIMCLTIFGNLLVCFAVLIYKHLQTQTNMMLLSLAVSDLFMVVSMAFNSSMILHGKWLFSKTLCTVVSSLGLPLCFISILHLCLLSINKYISIQKPFKHHELMSRRTVVVLMVLIWLVPSVVVNLPYADFDFRSSVFGCLKNTSHHNPSSSFILVLIFVILPFTLLFYVYIYLFKVVRQHARRINAMQPVVNAQHSSRNQRVVIRQTVKSVKTFALVIGAFVFCYTPFFLLGTYVSSKGTETISPDIMWAVTWLAFCNSFCNPVVYSLRYKRFRESFRKMLCYPQTFLSSRRSENFRVMASARRINALPPASAHVIRTLSSAPSERNSGLN